VDFLLTILTTTSLTWALTQESLFAEFRQWLGKKRQGVTSPTLLKLLYLPTCPFCAAHWIAAIVVTLAGLSPLYIVPTALGAVWGMALHNAIYIAIHGKKLKNLALETEIAKMRVGG
jgi:hypothetical protein